MEAESKVVSLGKENKMNIIDLLKDYDKKYAEGKPEVSDTEYDKLRETAQELHPEDPYFQSVGAPAPRDKAKLPFVLGSLNKVKIDSVYDWFKSKGKHHYIASDKVDGASFMVIYKNGKPIAGYTRGDGEFGKDISDKVKLFCPEISNKGYWVFRGEVVLQDPSRFGYKNRRNGAAGLLNKDDTSNCQYLRPWFYEIVEYKPASSLTDRYVENNKLNLDSETSRWEILEELFPVNTPRNWTIDYPVKEMIEERLVALLKHSRENNELYDVDGLVIAVNESDRENVMYPGNKVAFKVNLDAVPTVVTGIDWKVTRTGLVCATLEVAPTEIQGVTVTRVGAGINWKIMQEQGMGIGAKIGIVRSGDVIPYVEEVYTPSDNFDIGYCPSCGHPVVESGVWLACPNPECERKKLWEMEYWLISLGAENLTIVTLERIFDSLNIEPSIQALYELTLEDLLEVEGFGNKRATQVYNEIQGTLHTTHEKLLTAFGIPNVAKETATELIRHFRSVHGVLTAPYTELVEVEGIGDIVANNIREEQNRCVRVFLELKEKGLELEEKKVGALTGKVFAITGKLPMNRDAVVRMIEAKGGTWKNAVTKRTDYLITDNPSSGSGKNKKAQSYGTKLITFDELQELLNG